MSCAQRCAVLGFVLMLAAASTEARELEFSLESRIVGDSNVFRESSNRVEDGFYALSPRIVVRESNSMLNYLFSYRPTYETYFTTSGIDGFDHRARGDLSWRPTVFDTFGFNGKFSSRRTLRIEDQSAPSAPAPSLEESDRVRLQRSDVRLSYNRTLSRLLSVQASATFIDLDYSESMSTDTRVFSGQLGTQYILDPITIVGLSGTLRRSENRANGSQFTTDTETWDVAAFFQRALAPTLNVSVQVGPSFSSTEQKFSATGVPGGKSQSKSKSSSYIAAISIDKTWQRSDFSAAYTRFEGNGGSSGSTSINDNVTLNFHHRLSRRWSFRVFGSWFQSNEISEVPGRRNRDTIQYSALASITRRITRQLAVVGQFSFLTQDRNETAGSGSLGGVYSGFLSLRYTFDPVVF